MAAYTPIAFPPTSTGLTAADLTLSIESLGGVPLADPGVWTLTEHANGVYALYVPNVIVASTYYIYVTATPTVYCNGTIGDEFGTTVTPGTGYAPGASGNYTLAQLVTRWRQRLDDANATEYLWSNDELTEYADSLQKLLAVELRLFDDRTTAETSEVSFVQGEGLIDISQRVISIMTAMIDGETNYLTLRDAGEMGALYGAEWDSSSVTQDTPHTLVFTGMGDLKAYLYPPSDVAGTLKLWVRRLPLNDLVYATHSAYSLELDRYSHLFTHYIMWQAYMKQGTDTYNEKMAEQHRIAWEGRDGWGGDKEKIKVLVLKGRPYDAYNHPHVGMM